MNSLIIPTPPGFKFVPTVWSHGWYQLVPFQYDEARRVLSRVHQLSSGLVVMLHITPSEDDTTLAVTFDNLPLALTEIQQGEVIGLVRRILALDTDLLPLYDWLRDKAGYAWVERAGAGRVMVAASVWEDLVKMLLTTNTTWAMTKAMVSRVCALGTPYRDGLHAFPTPGQIAALSLNELGERIRAGYRSAYLHELALQIAGGSLDVEVWPELPSTELYKTIIALKGFGAYAAGSLLRLMGKHDYMAIDTVARDVFNRRINGGEKATDHDIRAYYEPFGQWRGLCQWLDIMASWFPS